MRRLYYIEHDGRVRVIERDGRVDLPDEKQVGVPFHESARRTLDDTEIVFGQAELAEHPEAWPLKDDLAFDEKASRLVHFAVSTSLFRPVVGVVVRSGREVLLVLPARGVAMGRWTLPGGFLGAFEQPQDGARREVLEETGVEVTELRLVGALTYQHSGQAYPILGLGFTAKAADRTLTPRAEEIAEARWVPYEEAGRLSRGFASLVFQSMAQEGIP